jgi:predicted alpha/beta superfamily hydrolase
MKIINVKGKKISIYDDYDGENKNLPLVIYNSYGGNALGIFNECIKLGVKDFIFVVIENIDWDNEMTPYWNPPIFKGDSEYLGLASQYLLLIEQDIIPKVMEQLLCSIKEYIITGYSLGGLFSLYSILKTNLFTKFVSCSGSLWYPNFIEFFKNSFNRNDIKIYLSLGDKEKNDKDISRCVEDKTKELYNYLIEKNIDVKFELNPGNHFKDISQRMAKGIKYILN